MLWREILLFFCIGCASLTAGTTNHYYTSTDDGMVLKQKTIGLIGGLSWESTALYYKLMNQSVHKRIGGLNSAKVLLYSLNYAPIVELEQQGKWREVEDELVRAARALQQGGAESIILCCNTLHKVAPAIEEAITIPFLHIADAAGKVLVRNHIHKVGLLGTQFTMEDGFYASRLKEKFGLEVLIPMAKDRVVLDRMIYDELCQGKTLPESKEILIRMINDLAQEGAKAVLLGCTELGMLIAESDVDLPVYDTTLLHALDAIDWSMK